MKEQLHTFPVIEAFKSEDECPFCSLHRQVEGKAIDFTLGGLGSYMQRDVRNETDRLGFCPSHMKMMFQYGNHLGNAIILQTYVQKLSEQFETDFAEFLPEKRSIIKKKKDDDGFAAVENLKKRQETCFVCERVNTTMDRYYETFFHLVRDAEFRALVEASKGFCYHHFVPLMEAAKRMLPNSQREWFYPTAVKLMQENVARVKSDLDWFIQKFDHRMKDMDWKNSKDALSRMMQKINGIYPAAPPYKEK